VVLKLETLDMARIHEQALGALVSGYSSTHPRGNGILKRAKIFFTETITPIEETHHAAQKANVHVNRLNKTMDQRTTDLADSDRKLKKGITQRKGVERALKKSGQNHTRLLAESRHLQKHLRHLTHRMLSAQEDKRRKISRELYDEIAQSLLGINVRLLTLKKEAKLNATSLKKEIASTQRLVKNSMRTINRFAREFGIQHES
jgi:signal transduction histidine kinase